jgi:hypothetical protein
MLHGGRIWSNTRSHEVANSVAQVFDARLQRLRRTLRFAFK